AAGEDVWLTEQFDVLAVLRVGEDSKFVLPHDEVDDVSALLRAIEDNASKRGLAFQPELALYHAVAQREPSHFHRTVAARPRFVAAQNTVFGGPGAEAPEPVLAQRLGKVALDR